MNMEWFLDFIPWLWALVFVITSLITLKIKDIDALWFAIGSIVTLIISIIFKDLHVLYQLLKMKQENQDS